MRNTRTTSPHSPHLFFLLIVLIFAFPLFAQEAPILAILPFEAIKVSQTDAAAVYPLMENSFVSAGVYTVITAEQRDQILGGADAAACTDKDCAVEIGLKLSADQIVQGSVARADGNFIVNAKIIAPSSSRTLSADSVSAAGAQDLESACNTLAVNLIRKAMPGSLAEKVEAPGRREPVTGGPMAAEEGSSETRQPADERQATGGARIGAEAGQPVGETGTEGQQAEEPEARADIVLEPREKSSRADLWPLVNICGGMFLHELGNVMGSVGFELQRKMADSVEENSSVNFGYYLTTGFSYASWAAAVAAVPTYLFVFPEKAFRLSRRGRFAFTAGVAVSLTGNALDLLAGAQRYTNDFLYEDYLSAGTGLDALYDRYQSGYTLYSVERLSSYALWLIGGGGMISAFFLSGPKEQLISGFWEKASLITGMTLVGLGSVTRTLALDARQSHVESGGDETDYKRYVLNSVLSYGLWALGGTAMILPFYTEIGGDGTGEDDQIEPSKELRPEQLQFLPAPNGVILRIAY